MRKALDSLFCIPFASRQVVNLLEANGVYFPPGTSERVKCLALKKVGHLSFIGFQVVSYLGCCLENRAGVDRL